MRLFALLLAAPLVACGTVPQPHPTPQHPSRMCLITCPNGAVFQRQHICRGGTRWFEDLIVTGEQTQRGADGGILSDMWLTLRGAYPKIDVALGTCSSVIQSIVLGRPVDQRGVHPGEPDPAHP